MTTCSKCGRPLPTGYPAGAETCIGGLGCKRIAHHYQRGLRDGVALVRRVVSADYATLTSIEWDEVNEEAAKMAGEG